MVHSQPLTDHAAQREAAEGKALATGGIHHGQSVRRQLGYGVIAPGGIGSAVAARIETQDLKVFGKCRHLRVPQPMVRAQRMGENQQGKVVPPFQPEVNPGAA